MWTLVIVAKSCDPTGGIAITNVQFDNEDLCRKAERDFRSEESRNFFIRTYVVENGNAS